MAGVKESLERRGLAKPVLEASSKSFAFASKICDCFSMSRSASVCTHEALCSGDRVWRTLLPALAEMKTEMEFKTAG